MALVKRVHPKPDPSHSAAEHIVLIADQIALSFAQSYGWSTWHSWNVINQAGVEAVPHDRFFWQKTGRFASCLGVSTNILAALRTAIDTDVRLEVSMHANSVQLMTSSAGGNYHAVVAMCFDTFTVVIDHSFQPTAMKILIGGEFVTASYVPIFDAEGQGRFMYSCEEGKYVLTMDSPTLAYSTIPSMQLSPTDPDAAAAQLAIPAALELQPVKGNEHVLMPPRKYVSVRSLLNEEPTLIAAVTVNDKYLATTVRIQVDFAKPTITMQVPMTDWMLKEQGKEWFQRLLTMPAGMTSFSNDTAIRFEVKLDAQKCAAVSRMERKQLVMLGLLSEEFGLHQETLMEMADSIFRAWKPYRRNDSVHKRVVTDRC